MSKRRSDIKPNNTASQVRSIHSAGSKERYSNWLWVDQMAREMLSGNWDLRKRLDPQELDRIDARINEIRLATTSPSVSHEIANQTKGIGMTGRLTLKQYHTLVVGFGYDGDKVMRWTKHRAHKELDKLMNRKQPPGPSNSASPLDDFIEELEGLSGSSQDSESGRKTPQAARPTQDHNADTSGMAVRS